MPPLNPAYQSKIPHPSQVVPKVVLIICAILVFAHLFYRLAHPDPVAHPLRIGLLHAEKRIPAEDLLRSRLILPSPWELARTPVADRLDMPLGSEGGALTYNARPFREESHLGEDLNGIGGENSDLGDPVFAAAHGVVTLAANAGGGWGNVVILQHRDPDGKFFQTFYGHLEHIRVALGQRVERGQTIGTIGTGDGQYLAHLHFEMREGYHLDVGAGYSSFSLGRTAAEARILSEAHAAGRARTQGLPALGEIVKGTTTAPEIEVGTAGDDEIGIRKRGVGGRQTGENTGPAAPEAPETAKMAETAKDAQEGSAREPRQ